MEVGERLHVEVAGAVEPFLVRLGREGADEAQAARFIGEDALCEALGVFALGRLHRTPAADAASCTSQPATGHSGRSDEDHSCSSLHPQLRQSAHDPRVAGTRPRLLEKPGRASDANPRLARPSAPAFPSQDHDARSRCDPSPNLLAEVGPATAPGVQPVSDITYIPTAERGRRSDRFTASHRSAS